LKNLTKTNKLQSPWMSCCSSFYQGRVIVTDNSFHMNSSGFQRFREIASANRSNRQFYDKKILLNAVKMWEIQIIRNLIRKQEHLIHRNIIFWHSPFSTPYFKLRKNTSGNNSFSSPVLRSFLSPLSWKTSPMDVNAVYKKNENEIHVSAALIQIPFHNTSYPKAINFGGLGFVIGHEIMHAFDYQGKCDTCNRFDANENLYENEAFNCYLGPFPDMSLIFRYLVNIFTPAPLYGAISASWNECRLSAMRCENNFALDNICYGSSVSKGTRKQ
uniref:Peptidase_M13 domain-containing protein n=1 Tax=Echinostoma caproni TaxID=27848 RepID=A0A183A7Z9_9TREM